jgi:G3E family GTPase
MLPVLVLGGYLGAGKTTLLNRLLRNAGGRRIAVLVNDFGEIGIDADLIESRDGDVMNLAGGCVCCAVGSDLIGALVALPERSAPPDLVLIETSGVALPGAVARAVRLAPGIEVDGVVVLADAETVQARADDRYVGDTVRQQLLDADLLVLNKADLVSAERLAALHAWCAALAPRARIVEATEADIPPEWVLGLADTPEHDRQAGAPPAPLPAHRIAAPATPAAARFTSESFRIDRPVDAAALGRVLADPALGLIRAKGVVRDTATDGWTVLQGVGSRMRTTPAAAGSPAATRDGPGRVVVIGLLGRFDRAAVAAAIDTVQAQ